MAAPQFVPVSPVDRPRSYESPDHVPAAWRADRPAEVSGPQPAGAQLGYQGPDQGYGLLLAERFRDRLQLQAGEDVDDAITGCLGVALRRASSFGRAPTIHDFTVAFTIWGFLDRLAADRAGGPATSAVRGRAPCDAPLRRGPVHRRQRPRGDVAADAPAGPGGLPGQLARAARRLSAPGRRCRGHRRWHRRCVGGLRAGRRGAGRRSARAGGRAGPPHDRSFSRRLPGELRAAHGPGAHRGQPSGLRRGSRTVRCSTTVGAPLGPLGGAAGAGGGTWRRSWPRSTRCSRSPRTRRSSGARCSGPNVSPPRRWSRTRRPSTCSRCTRPTRGAWSVRGAPSAERGRSPRWRDRGRAGG